MDRESIHGIDHWEAVYRNGVILSAQENVDSLVVSLFAYLHDCRREDDGWDEFHGERAAEFVTELRQDGFLDYLTELQYSQLREACFYHNKGVVSDSATVGACYDADRLELTRCGICPRPELMSTKIGRHIAEKMQDLMNTQRRY